VDAVILHPRFHEDKFKRLARHDLYEKAAAVTRLPLIANGDISGSDFIRNRAARFAPVSGLMIGRLAAAQPWLFGQWRNPELAVDHPEIVRRLGGYLAEDFPPETALRRLKIWMPYFACNFAFGHTLYKAVQQAVSLDEALERALAFLAADPERLDPVSVSGI
jgi:tRNA-dihydrouridine synthase